MAKTSVLGVRAVVCQCSHAQNCVHEAPQWLSQDLDIAQLAGINNKVMMMQQEESGFKTSRQLVERSRVPHALSLDE